MTVINTNVGALTARTYAVQANQSMQKSMERLSSGLRVNSASDDAAGLSVANKMQSQLVGMNVAIRNSQDGISLVQTAEAGMGEITNMIIRMRELAVQMNNGVYTGSDRSNAQLEIDALLAEIDKIANNTAFNDVKVLNGTYAQEIRAGNTNSEKITVAIDRMNTDTLGGQGISRLNTTAASASVDPHTSTASKTTVSALESDAVIINRSVLNAELDNTVIGSFANRFAGGQFTLGGADSALFSIDATHGTLTSVGALDFESPSDADTDNRYQLEVTYQAGANRFSDTVELIISNREVTANRVVFSPVVTTVEEGQNISIDSVGSTGKMGFGFKDFADTDFSNGAFGGAFSLTGADAGVFEIDSNGQISLINTGAGTNGTLNFESPSDANNDNVYDLNVVYTNAQNVSYTEALQITVTDSSGDPGVSWASTVDNEDLQTFVTMAPYMVNSSKPQNAHPNIDFTTSAGLDTLGADVKAFILAEGGVASVSFNSPQTEITQVGRALQIANTAATNTYGGSLAIQTVSGKTISGTVQYDVTQQGAVLPNFSAATFDAVLQVETTFTGGASGGEAVVVDVDDVANATKFSALNDFRTNLAPGGSYILSATSSSNGSADFVFDTITNELSLQKGKGAGTYTATLTYNALYLGNAVSFTQNISVTTADASEQAAQTVTGTAALNTTFASQTNSGIVAGNSLLLMEEALVEGTLTSIGNGRVLSEALNDFVTAYGGGVFTLAGTDRDFFEIDSATGNVTSKAAIDYEDKSQYNLTINYADGSQGYTETVVISVIDDPSDNGITLADVSLTTSVSAGEAVVILDNALSQISASQAKLGAIQNRLQHNIDNLSMASMLTETSRGRVIDADFARETNELSKQQILGQAATSMLAQANQSKQAVLTLLG